MKLCRLCENSNECAAERFLAIGREDAGFEEQPSGVETRPSTERNLAAALEFAEKSALGGDAGARVVVIERGEQLACLRIIGARFDAERSLSNGRKHDVRGQDLRDLVA